MAEHKLWISARGDKHVYDDGLITDALEIKVPLGAVAADTIVGIDEVPEGQLDTQITLASEGIANFTVSVGYIDLETGTSYPTFYSTATSLATSGRTPLLDVPTSSPANAELILTIAGTGVAAAATAGEKFWLIREAIHSAAR